VDAKRSRRTVASCSEEAGSRSDRLGGAISPQLSPSRPVLGRDARTEACCQGLCQAERKGCRRHGGRAGARPPLRSAPNICIHVWSLEVGADQAQEGRDRRAARPALHEARTRDHGRRARGWGDPEPNFTLAAAVQKARDYFDAQGQHPAAIDRGTGTGGADDAIERVVYEGYGPGGVAMLVETLTDNRNRTSRRHPPRLREARRQPRRARLRGLGVREARRRPRDADRYSEEDLIAAIDAVPRR